MIFQLILMRIIIWNMPYVHAKNTNLWQLPEHLLTYLAQADTIPHRAEGEAVLLEFLPPRVSRVLDLGSGDGRLLAFVRIVHPHLHGVALDFSNAMIQRLEERFAMDPSVGVVRHDLDTPLPPLDGSFDAVVSSFAIHHLVHARKRSLYAEIFDRLAPGGVFCNLEHVASATASLHARFLERLGIVDEDPSNKLLDVETPPGARPGASEASAVPPGALPGAAIHRMRSSRCRWCR
jgi:tRNA (cmo5U34)-methyltransferase